MPLKGTESERTTSGTGKSYIDLKEETLPSDLKGPASNVVKPEAPVSIDYSPTVFGQSYFNAAAGSLAVLEGLSDGFDKGAQQFEYWANETARREISDLGTEIQAQKTAGIPAQDRLRWLEAKGYRPSEVGAEAYGKLHADVAAEAGYANSQDYASELIRRIDDINDPFRTNFGFQTGQPMSMLTRGELLNSVAAWIHNDPAAQKMVLDESEKSMIRGQAIVNEEAIQAIESSMDEAVLDKMDRIQTDFPFMPGNQAAEYVMSEVSQEIQIDQIQDPSIKARLSNKLSKKAQQIQKTQNAKVQRADNEQRKQLVTGKLKALETGGTDLDSAAETVTQVMESTPEGSPALLSMMYDFGNSMHGGFDALTPLNTVDAQVNNYRGLMKRKMDDIGYSEATKSRALQMFDAGVDSTRQKYVEAQSESVLKEAKSLSTIIKREDKTLADEITKYQAIDHARQAINIAALDLGHMLGEEDSFLGINPYYESPFDLVTKVKTQLESGKLSRDQQTMATKFLESAGTLVFDPKISKEMHQKFSAAMVTNVGKIATNNGTNLDLTLSNGLEVKSPSGSLGHKAALEAKRFQLQTGGTWFAEALDKSTLPPTLKQGLMEINATALANVNTDTIYDSRQYVTASMALLGAYQSEIDPKDLSPLTQAIKGLYDFKSIQTALIHNNNQVSYGSTTPDKFPSTETDLQIASAVSEASAQPMGTVISGLTSPTGDVIDLVSGAPDKIPELAAMYAEADYSGKNITKNTTEEHSRMSPQASRVFDNFVQGTNALENNLDMQARLEASKDADPAALVQLKEEEKGLVAENNARADFVISYVHSLATSSNASVQELGRNKSLAAAYYRAVAYKAVQVTKDNPQAELTYRRLITDQNSGSYPKRSLFVQDYRDYTSLKTSVGMSSDIFRDFSSRVMATVPPEILVLDQSDEEALISAMQSAPSQHPIDTQDFMAFRRWSKAVSYIDNNDPSRMLLLENIFGQMHDPSSDRTSLMSFGGDLVNVKAMQQAGTNIPMGYSKYSMTPGIVNGGVSKVSDGMPPDRKNITGTVSDIWAFDVTYNPMTKNSKLAILGAYFDDAPKNDIADSLEQDRINESVFVEDSGYSFVFPDGPDVMLKRQRVSKVFRLNSKAPMSSRVSAIGSKCQMSQMVFNILCKGASGGGSVDSYRLYSYTKDGTIGTPFNTEQLNKVLSGELQIPERLGFGLEDRDIDTKVIQAGKSPINVNDLPSHASDKMKKWQYVKNSKGLLESDNGFRFAPLSNRENQ